MEKPKNEIKKQWWLIDLGGIPFWVWTTKEEAQKTGHKVLGGPRE